SCTPFSRDPLRALRWSRQRVLSSWHDRRALEREGIRPDLIVGSSAGSIIGALYSYFGDVQSVYTWIEEVFASEVFESFESKYFGTRLPLDGHVQRGVKGFFS